MAVVAPATGSMYIDFNPENGQPYLGFDYAGSGIHIQVFLCDKRSAASFRKGMEKAVEQLLKTMPVLITDGGGLDGASLRNT